MKLSTIWKIFKTQTHDKAILCKEKKNVIKTMEEQNYSIENIN